LIAVASDVIFVQILVVYRIYLGSVGNIKGWLKHAWAACFTKHSAQAEECEKLVGSA